MGKSGLAGAISLSSRYNVTTQYPMDIRQMVESEESLWDLTTWGSYSSLKGAWSFSMYPNMMVSIENSNLVYQLNGPIPTITDSSATTFPDGTWLLLATQEWVEEQGYGTGENVDLDGYATQEWVNQQAIPFTTNTFVGSAVGGLPEDADLMGKSIKEILTDLLSVTILDTQITTVQAPSLSTSSSFVTISNPNNFDVQVYASIKDTVLPQYSIPGAAGTFPGAFENVLGETIPANGTLSVEVQLPETEIGVLPTLKNYTYACYFKWHSYSSDTSSVRYS